MTKIYAGCLKNAEGLLIQGKNRFGHKLLNLLILNKGSNEKNTVSKEKKDHTCETSSKLLKTYLRVSFDLLDVSCSCSSGVFKRQYGATPLS